MSVSFNFHRIVHCPERKVFSDVYALFGPSECDSPFALTDYTLEYIEQQWASEIDFVVCKYPLLRSFLPKIGI